MESFVPLAYPPMMFLSFLPYVVAASWIPRVYAWGAVGHEVVATVAQIHLHPDVMPKLCDILELESNSCHLALVATWADRVRINPRYRWSGPLHYIGAVDDYPRTTCAFPGQNGWEGGAEKNVLNAIRNTTTILQEYEDSRRAGVSSESAPGDVQDALKFLIHFVGDMHQPLHLTGRDRGGNEDKVAFDGRTTNLHSVWDNFLIAERIRTLPANYSKPLPIPEVERNLRDTIYDPYVRRIFWEGLRKKWHHELKAWLHCPTSNSRQRQSASTWQFVLSLLAPRKGHGEDGGNDDLDVDDDKLCPYAWAKPVHQLNCQIVWPKELDETDFFDSFFEYASEQDIYSDEDERDAYDAFRKRKSHYFELYTPEYAGKIKKQWIIEKLLTQAGIRLASILNRIFAEDGNGDFEGYHFGL